MPHVPCHVSACLLALLTGCIFAPAAQSEDLRDSAYVSRSWVTDDGLPHNVVVRVEQDRIGYLWLATMAGLSRFDGREFTTFAVPGDSGPRGRNIRAFTLLPDGGLLFLPATGGVLQLKDDVISPHPLSREPINDQFLQIYAEPTGVIWAEVGSGILRWENGHIERFGDEDGINRRRLHFSWATAASGRTWIGGPDFLGYYANGRITRVSAPSGVYRVAPARSGGIWAYGTSLLRWEQGELSQVAGAGWPPSKASTRCLFEDRAGVLWIATSRQGVFRFDGKNYESVPNVEAGVEFITEDRDGDIWLATDGGGIRRLRPKSSISLDIQVTSVTADPDGAVWFAAGANGVIRRIGHVQETFPMLQSRIPLSVTAVCADRDRRIWMTTSAGLFRIAAADPTRPTRIDPSIRDGRMLFAARNGDLWTVGPAGLGYYRNDTFHAAGSALAPEDHVTEIAEGATGPVWFGTSRGNLFRTLGDQVVPAERPTNVRWTTIHALLPEASGALWVGTAEGLIFLDHGVARRITLADGLPDQVVLHLLEDITDLWFATAGGLFRIPRVDLTAFMRGERNRVTAIAYGPEEGLPAVSPITNEMPAAGTDREGNLWFCTYKGAVEIVPARVPHDSTVPPVLIKEIRLDDRVVDQRIPLRVPSGAHRLEFHFAALSFAAPQRVRLRHQLEGFDNTWTDTSPDRIARYAKLPPGEYHLRVIASNGEGIWNERGADFAFTVTPAWYQTLWFGTAMVLAFAATVAAIARYWSHRKFRARLARLEHEHALEQERARIARDMHDELGGSVTGINLAVQRLRDIPGAQVNGLADVLDRRVRALTVELERVVWTISPKHGTLDQLASFIERFVPNLLAESSVCGRVCGRDAIPAIPVSPDVQHHVLAITKEAINNVLKHSKAHEVVIELRCAKDTFTLLVRDDGVGFDPEAHEFSDRNGLRNMRARIAEVNGALDLRSAPGRGTEVVLCVKVAPRVTA